MGQLLTGLLYHKNEEGTYHILIIFLPNTNTIASCLTDIIVKKPLDERGNFL